VFPERKIENLYYNKKRSFCRKILAVTAFINLFNAYYKISYAAPKSDLCFLLPAGLAKIVSY
jgi:hypothetical protein